MAAESYLYPAAVNVCMDDSAKLYLDGAHKKPSLMRSGHKGRVSYKIPSVTSLATDYPSSSHGKK
jgi:hypothetical protein